MKSVLAMCPMCGYRQKLSLFNPESTQAFRFKCRDCGYLSRVDAQGRQLPDEDDEPLPPRPAGETGFPIYSPWDDMYQGEHLHGHPPGTMPPASTTQPSVAPGDETRKEETRDKRPSSHEMPGQEKGPGSGELEHMREQKETMDKYIKIKKEMDELERKRTGEEIPVAGAIKDRGRGEEYDGIPAGRRGLSGAKKSPHLPHGTYEETPLPEPEQKSAAHLPGGAPGDGYDPWGRWHVPGMPHGGRYYRPPDIPRDRTRIAGWLFILGAIVAGILYILALLMYGTDSFQDSQVFDVEGTVVDAGRGTHIANVTITLDGDENSTVRTTEDGRFTFKNVPMGRHKLTFNATGYRTQHYKFYVSPQFESEDISIKLTVSDQPGETETKETREYREADYIFLQISLGFIGAAAAFTAGVFSFQRQKYLIILGLGMACAVLTLFAPVLLFGDIFIVPAMYFAHRSKPFFRGALPPGGLRRMPRL